ncbi:MAG TPA: DUF2911 domain-containing protein [Gemmatimonadales bacterium]|nr:DUF2911 domain-containing protein [Gemmatimonadales bacterium]
MTSRPVVRWSAVVGGILLIAGIRLAPLLTGSWVLPASVLWLAILAWLLILAFRVLRTLVGPAVALIVLGLGVAAPIAVTAIPFAPGLAVRLPCPRNWTWMPTWMLRPSPMGSASLTLAGGTVKVCYGRPAARGRKMIGGSPVPFGELWRTGANEPTTIITPVPLRVAGVDVPAGRSSLYTVPGPETWEVILNASTSQWGIEPEYEGVRGSEIGRAIVRSEEGRPHRERFTISFAPASGDSTGLVLEWETTRVEIPLVVRR